MVAGRLARRKCVHGSGGYAEFPVGRSIARRAARADRRTDPENGRPRYGARVPAISGLRIESRVFPELGAGADRAGAHSVSRNAVRSVSEPADASAVAADVGNCSADALLSDT